MSDEFILRAYKDVFASTSIAIKKSSSYLKNRHWLVLDLTSTVSSTGGSGGAGGQGLTLVHVSAQRKRFLCDRG